MFGNILGNDHLKKTLLRLRAGGRMPNAMLFAGPDGVGKRLFAIDLARSFVCRSDGDDVACGVCPSCVRAGEFAFPKPDARDDFKKIISSNHPDVGTVVAATRTIAVDAIRDLEAEAHFRPYEGNARTFIIDDADKMNDAASNALLKTLEEPAPTTHLILISSRPETLLPTIRSRCQTFRFAPVATAEIEALLVERKDVIKADARLLAKMSQGSVGAALDLDPSDLRNRRLELIDVLYDALISRNRVSLLRASERMNEAKNKEFFEHDLSILESLIHDVWSIRTGQEGTHIVNEDLTDKLSILADKAADLPSLLTSIQTIRENLIVNINRKVATDALFIGMAA